MELPLADASALGGLAATSTTPLLASAPPLVPGSAAADALGSGSGQKATPAATGALPVAWLATAPVPPLPADGILATVSDRRLRLGPAGAPEEQQPSLYRLCRQWVQNDPDLPAPLPDPLPASKLSPLAPRSEEATATLQQPAPEEAPVPTSAAAPAGEGSAAAAGAAAGAQQGAAEGGGSAGGSGSEPPAIDVLMRHHKQHWAAVRRHKQAQAAAATQRHAQRLQTFMTLGRGSAAVPVPMQQ
ncbi:hypothetical protein C2E21_6810 [Chlorella sorokiniana]|uniref:SCAN box domain-containing protein n=1 Tax=Chlorella sorokiniana TaxID=3076 RepID=A0A2P6TJT9_CHLSO|nr:hypothetical protein C2E21_6810 [Chlorella sorokiniana]|eukprot:PRW44347.1 hypothetical protein C2E21_6810 [Chlorella sorokiniana]